MRVMEPTRNSLLLRVRNAADIEGWAEFYKLYRPFLYTVALRAGLSHEDAREVCQEVFVKLVKTLPGFEYNPVKGRFRGWLKTITRNAVNDLRRYQGRRPTVAMEQESCEQSLLEDDGTDWNKEYRQRILEYAMLCVKRTSEPKTWCCFEQHLLNGRTATDVGNELSLNANAVYVNVSRVLSRVRTKCEDYDEELVDE